MENQNKDIKKCKSEELNFIKNEFEKLKKMYVELKACCETSSHTITEKDVEKQADKVIAGYFPDDFSKQDIVKLFQIINSKLRQDDFKTTNGKKTIDSGVISRPDWDVDEIRRIVMGVLKIYDADKTGRVDYALESAGNIFIYVFMKIFKSVQIINYSYHYVGGQIISTRCTQRYNIHTRAFKILGLTLYYESNNPRTVIQGNNLQPGMCWAFQDFPGYLLVKLRSPIYITGFTVEHAPRSNLPNREMKSAPKKFEVWVSFFIYLFIFLKFIIYPLIAIFISSGSERRK